MKNKKEINIDENNHRWLPHLVDAVPTEAFGYTISMYSIALEGWRRGLTLNFINAYYNNEYEINYTLSNGTKEYTFRTSRSDAIPKKALSICMNKNLTYEYLSEAGVSVPEGKIFEGNVDQEIIEYANALGYPLVIKPSDGTGGKGVIANIKNEDEFKESLTYVKYDLNFTNLIVERYAPGEDHRIYVIDNKVIGAFKRIPPNVIGDGKNNIRVLLKKKNQERYKIPALYNRPIKVDTEIYTTLREVGYTLDSVPDKGERVFLKKKNNVSSGGDPIDVTDDLTDELKEIAIEASNAIPGLVQCGVDMIIDYKNNTGVVIEVNGRPHIRVHVYPMEGKARDIPKAIIDYYFPETIENSNSQKGLFYFDFKQIKDILESGYAQRVTVPAVPQHIPVRRSFTVSGVVQGVNYRRWVRKKALNANLNGFAKNLKNGEVFVVVAGENDNMSKFQDSIYHQSPSKAKVDSVTEQEWEKPVKIGFEVRGENQPKKLKKNVEEELNDKTKQLKDLELSLYKALEKNKQIQYHKNQAEKKYKEIKQSRIWRYTLPLRKTLSFFKKVRLSKT